MSFQKYLALNLNQIESQLNTSVKNGLVSSDANERLKKQGLNTTKLNEVKPIQILLRQFRSAFVYLLIIVAIISFVLGEPLDGFMILFFVFINTSLGFYQEYKSENTLKLLKKYIVKKTLVIRDSIETYVDTSDLVTGDIVILETGDIASVDLRLIEENNLIVDESTLTGESKNIKKVSTPIGEISNETYKARNIVFSGTTIVEGKGIGVVIATGKETEFGKITKLTIETQEKSSFEKQIDKFSRFILILTSLTLIFVFLTHLLFKGNISILDLTIFSIALAVGVIPEAMPLVTTFSLSMGAATLAKKHVIVKRLSAIEDLGGIQILCTDKTGTITQNKLAVAEILEQTSKENVIKFGLLGATYVNNESTPNNSFDLAIHNFATSMQQQMFSTIPKLYEIPFNPDRRRNSALVKIDAHEVLVVRGAAESILPYVTNINQQQSEKIISWVLREGTNGNRIIAIATKKLNAAEYTVKDEENNLALEGLISFADPIKESTIPAVQKANNYGVTIKMITGDSPEVAGAVAFKTGIAQNANEVITGTEFDKLKHNEQLNTLAKTNVFARVSPEQKHKIISMLQNKFEVGYLGDGINDAPALKAAGVAIAVDTAADVSKEVSDIVLLKNDLGVIIDGIEQGRKTFVNVTNYIKATLASNFGNFYAMAFATLVIDFLPMLPIQILLVNLLSDFPMISIASDNVEESELKNPKSYDVKEIILVATLLGLVSTSFDFMMFGIFKNGGAASLQTNWFIGSILTELILIYSIRSKLSIFKTKTLPSKQIVILTVFAAVVTVITPFTSFGQNVFKFIMPTTQQIGILATVVVGYFISTEIVKDLYYRYINTLKA